MKNRSIVEVLVGTIEESFQGYEIFIENNPDYYRSGFDWCVSIESDICDSGLAFSIEDAFIDAQNAIVLLQNKGSRYS